MSCECAQCRQHYRTLGIAYGVPSESEIEEAYREAVKLWHPDQYENYASLRADAEEHSKQLQIAYKGLKEHNAAPEELPVESVAVQPREASVESTVVQPQREGAPSLTFGDAPGCLVARQFTMEVEEIIARHLGKIDTALAIVDLGGARSYPASYSHFLLLATRGIMVRDARNIVSLLWYKDLGDIHLIDKQGKPGMWQSLVGGSSSGHSKYALEIYRNDGMLFHAISGQVEDSVKKIIYDFLLIRKSQMQS